MAGRMEAKIAALLSLLAATLIAHTLLLQPPPRAFTDRLLSALRRFDGRQLVVELVNRRNMIILCNAILLLILKDAGLLAAPARRRGGTAAGGEGGCCDAQPQPKPKSIVEAWRGSTAAAAASDAKSATVVADDGRVQRERPRGPEPDKATARLRRGKPPSSNPAEKQSSERCFNYFDHGVGNEIAAVEDKIACLHAEPVAHQQRSRGKEMARQETEAECVDDVDEMNKKFEEFIASTRRKMQLESLQLVKV